LKDEKVASKLDASDKDSLTKAIDETISWLDKNQTAEKDEFEHHQKELENKAMPIMTKLYQQGGMPTGEGFPGAQPHQPHASSGPSSGPKVEEVD
jgi:L1 cell adhesion molecule like protein